MLKPSVTLPTPEKLDHYYRQINRVILSRQDPLTGLLPASTAINSHGNYTDAWVRDNVYAIQAVWGLAIAYRKSGCDKGRAYLLEQAVVKVMRGLLLSMMKQADKVERFKRSRDPNDALHAKYDIRSGDTVVGDDEWGHLQLDATGIFILMLAQMTKSGLRIVFSLDEVNFVQNLVYYLGRAYRIPDFGIWERGNKSNDGRAEINASSLGMVKAALEAMRGLNLFGEGLCQEAVIHVVSDEIAQARTALESLLPRESNSKETDAALLSVIGYPAFAIESRPLVERTRSHILDKLGGRFGCKRFLLDGHQTATEDTSRLHYEYDELKKFEHIESEWPLFFTYLFIEALFRRDYVEASYYQNKLQLLSVDKDDLQLLPELYYVPLDKIDDEKSEPGSQKRVPNDNVPLIWAQSLYYLGCLLDDDLLSIEDIDPLRRHTRIGRKQRVEVQLGLLAENEVVKRKLEEIGHPSEEASDIEGLSIKESRELSRVYSYIGRNQKLQLSGRPIRRMRVKMSSQVYRIERELVAFLPHFQNQTEFYINLDNNMLVEQMAVELQYLVRHWDQPGKPLIILAISEAMLNSEDRQALLDFLSRAKLGQFNSISVISDSISKLIHNAGHETIKELPGFSFLDSADSMKSATDCYLQFDSQAPMPPAVGGQEVLRPIEDSATLVKSLLESNNLYDQINILELLKERHGVEFSVMLDDGKDSATVKTLIEEVYRKACDIRCWGVIRQAAGLLDKYYDRLDVAAQEILVRQKQIMVGRHQMSSVTISEILTSKEIYNRIQEFCISDVREAQMNQEVLYYLGLLIKEKKNLFNGILTLRTGHLLLLCVNEYANELDLEEDEAFGAFAQLSPYEIKVRLQTMLGHYQKPAKPHLQTLHYVKPGSDLVFVNFSESDDPSKPDAEQDWLSWRKQSGTILSMQKRFYKQLWELLGSCNGVVIGDRYNYRNRLDTHYVQGAMTPGERSFALLVDRMLNEIPAPEYRYLTIEAIMAISAFVQANPGLHFDDYLVLDLIIEKALELEGLGEDSEVGDIQVEGMIADPNSRAWKAFYHAPPHKVAHAINLGLERLLLDEEHPGVSDAVTSKPEAESAEKAAGL